MAGERARMTAGSYLWLGAAMTIFLAASSLLRRYVDVQALWLVLAALALYCIGNLMMVRLMREGGMAVAISVSAVLQLLMANVVAIAVFGERPTLVQFAGIALGAVAVVLILSPWKGAGG
jgi:drug/metabolite transporter (DMT)-like permease